MAIPSAVYDAEPDIECCRFSGRLFLIGSSEEGMKSAISGASGFIRPPSLIRFAGICVPRAPHAERQHGPGTACRDVAMIAAFPSRIALSCKIWDVLSALQAFSLGQRG
jgi:hypothetical protein